MLNHFTDCHTVKEIINTFLRYSVIIISNLQWSVINQMILFSEVYSFISIFHAFNISFIEKEFIYLINIYKVS